MTLLFRLIQIPDGATSSAILIQYLNSVYPEYVKNHLTYRLHTGKQHGVEAKYVPENVKLVVVPDAAVKMEEQKKIKESGKDLIIIDHHDVDKDSEYSILVNNQLSPEFTPNLVGVGMVYKFLQALDNELNLHNADKYLDLVALGHISDIADARDSLVNYYIQTGLQQIKNPFLKELIKKQSFSMKNEVTPITVAFYIVPLLNGCIRTGSQEEKEMVFKALLGSDEQVYYKRGKEYQSIQKFMARELVNIKNRQDRLRDKFVSAIESKIEQNHLLDNKILFVQGDDSLEKNFTGLISSKLANEFKRPVLLGKTINQNYVAGSIRGYDKGSIKDFKQVLLDTELFEFVEGHPQAAGFKIKKENIAQVNKLLNERFKNLTIDIEEHDVDFIIPSHDFTGSFIRQIYDHRNLWAHNVETPKVVITGIELTQSDIILLGKNSKVLKFVNHDIEYIKFRYDEDEYNRLFSKDGTYTINVIGRCDMNEWQGKKTPQVIIEEFEIESVRETDWSDLF